MSLVEDIGKLKIIIVGKMLAQLFFSFFPLQFLRIEREERSSFIFITDLPSGLVLILIWFQNIPYSPKFCLIASQHVQQYFSLCFSTWHQQLPKQFRITESHEKLPGKKTVTSGVFICKI